MEKAKDRLEVLEKIREYEKNGWWEKDVENDKDLCGISPDRVWEGALGSYQGDLPVCEK